jgi:hypothetical protein
MQSTTLRSPMMNWLPLARDFRADLSAALVQAKRTDRLENLASLATYRLGFVETIQLDRALTRLGRATASGFSPIRLAVLASSTIDHLLAAFRVAGLRRRLLIDVHSGVFGQYRQDLLNPSAFVHRFVLRRFRSLPGSSSQAFRSRQRQLKLTKPITKFIRDLQSFWRRARDRNLQRSNHTTNLPRHH